MPEIPLFEPPAGSPFHGGEIEAQCRAGVAERMDGRGRRNIRDHMPDQHRAFFAQLPFILAGLVDDDGQPWASVLTGQPGFAHSPDPGRLVVHGSHLPGDPARACAVEGRPIGILGIELHTRRRNRVNGILEAVGQDGLTIRVEQSFGNCPQYIQLRHLHWVGTPGEPPAIVETDRLDGPARALVERADTFFVATASGIGERGGADVSHRGGKPGFVRVEGNGVLTVPDFAGNFYFNTIGNLLRDPRAGLVFPDFSTGDMLYVAADAEIVWDGPDVRAFAGAERLVRFRVRKAVRVAASLPLRAADAVPSPTLARTGSWDEATRALHAFLARDTPAALAPQ